MQIAEMGLEGVAFTVTAGGERARCSCELLGRHNVLQCAGGDCGGAAQRDDAGGVRGGAGRDCARATSAARWWSGEARR